MWFLILTVKSQVLSVTQAFLFCFVLFRTERNDENPYKSSNLVIGYVYFLIETVVEVEGFIFEMIEKIII